MNPKSLVTMVLSLALLGTPAVADAQQAGQALGGQQLLAGQQAKEPGRHQQRSGTAE